jgi:hypothetical protein
MQQFLAGQISFGASESSLNLLARFKTIPLGRGRLRRRSLPR